MSKLVGTYDGQSIDLTNIRQIEVYQYPGSCVSILVHLIKYTPDPKPEYPFNPRYIELKVIFGSSTKFVNREEATKYCEQLRKQIEEDWEQALLLVNGVNNAT